MKLDSNAFFFHPNSWFEPFQWERVFSVLPSQNSSPPRRNRESPSTGSGPLAETSGSIQYPASLSRPIHVDLGAGDGGFLCQRARSHPETQFLAVERLLGRARKIARRAFREQLSNVRVVRIEASYAVEHLFPASSIHSMTILFPDPWPKRRHHGNRLIHGSFLDRCANCLQNGGWLAIKTDDAPYFEQISRALAECVGLELWPDIQPQDLIPERTDFEQEFLSQKRSIYFAAARRAP